MNHASPLAPPRFVTVTDCAFGGGHVLRFSEAPDVRTGRLVATWMPVQNLAELQALGGLIVAHLAGAPWDAAAAAAVRQAFADDARAARQPQRLWPQP